MRRVLTGLLFIVSILVLGVFVTPSESQKPIIAKETVGELQTRQRIVPIVDNVIILYDTSRSLSKNLGATGMTKLQAQKKVLEERIRYAPDNNINVGLYSFAGGFKEHYKVQPFNREMLLAAVEQLPTKPSGGTILENAMIKLGDILKEVSGKTAVFVFSDGTYSPWGPEGVSPVVFARKYAEQYEVSFVVISTAEGAAEKKVLEAVSSINASSRVIPIENLWDRPEYFMGSVFAIEEYYVMNWKSVNKIVGYTSEQPVEEKKEVVEEKIPPPFGYVMEAILFDFDEDGVKPEYTSELEKVGKILKERGNTYIVLSGFTDNIGTEEYNLALSKKRAQSVSNYLAKSFGIDQNRIILNWYGKDAPAVSNATPEGRSKNRRVIGYIAETS